MYEHVNENNGQIEVMFVKIEDNNADIFTKNVSKEKEEYHTDYLGKEEDID